MAYDSVPLNWEMLTMLGGTFAAGATVAWQIGHRITSVQINEWQLKYGFAQQRSEATEVELERFKRKLEVAQDRFNANERLMASLQADLAVPLPRKRMRKLLFGPYEPWKSWKHVLRSMRRCDLPCSAQKMKCGNCANQCLLPTFGTACWEASQG
jgi:hypothetical protein